MLQEKARRLADELREPNFKALWSWVQRWTQRHNLTSVVLHGAGGSVNLEEAEEWMATIQGLLQDFEPENIFNMDETGLFYRWLPNRSFVPAKQRRAARGTKSMKAKERVTLLLACNATGSKKVPVAIIGKAALPLCFRRPGCASPLTYFSQRNSRMDGVVLKSGFTRCFCPSFDCAPPRRSPSWSTTSPPTTASATISWCSSPSPAIQHLSSSPSTRAQLRR